MKEPPTDKDIDTQKTQAVPIARFWTAEKKSCEGSTTRIVQTPKKTVPSDAREDRVKTLYTNLRLCIDE